MRLSPLFRGIVSGDVIDLQVLSQEIMRNTAYEDRDYIVVSISDPGDEEIPIPESPRCMGVLRVQFHDIESPWGNCELMSEEQAKRISTWVESYKPARPHDKWPLIVVHCFAGICRSSGVAAALSLHWNGNDSFFWDKEKSGYVPNTWVYVQMTKALSGIEKHI